MDVNQKDVGAYLDSFHVGAGSATAADSDDNVKVTGKSMDLSAARGKSGKLVITYKTSVTAGQTLKFAIEHQDSADDSNWDTAVVDLASTTVESGAVTAEVDCYELDVDLSGAKAYRRYNITPDLSHSGTDTVVWAACFVALADA